MIEKALVQVLGDQQRHDLAVARVDGASLEELYDKYVSQGTPVLLWVTIGMEPPRVSALFTLEDSGGDLRLALPPALRAVGGHGGRGLFVPRPLGGPGDPLRRPGSLCRLRRPGPPSRGGGRHRRGLAAASRQV